MFLISMTKEQNSVGAMKVGVRVVKTLSGYCTVRKTDGEASSKNRSHRVIAGAIRATDEKGLPTQGPGTDGMCMRSPSSEEQAMNDAREAISGMIIGSCA